MGEYGVPKKPESRIVLALDQMSKERALKIAEEASGLVWGFKVHDLLFHYGAEMVYELGRWGKVIADARLCGSLEEMQSCINIFRTAGASVITISSVIKLEGPCDDLASMGVTNGYGYMMARVEGTTFNVLRSIDGEELPIYGHPLIAAENLTEALEKLNDGD